MSNLLFINNKDNKSVKLSYIDISNNSFTKNCFIYINNIIYFSPFISSINISYNSLYFEGISNIFSCINKQSKLVSLDLSKTNLDEKSIEFISKKLDKSIAPILCSLLGYIWVASSKAEYGRGAGFYYVSCSSGPQPY